MAPPGRPGGPRRRLWRRRVLTGGAWLRWRTRHGRKSPLQRDFESGDPARVAAVEQFAREILADIEAGERR
jgi:hypothetical protein